MWLELPCCNFSELWYVRPCHTISGVAAFQIVCEAMSHLQHKLVCAKWCPPPKSSVKLHFCHLVYPNHRHCPPACFAVARAISWNPWKFVVPCGHQQVLLEAHLRHHIPSNSWLSRTGMKNDQCFFLFGKVFRPKNGRPASNSVAKI